MGCAVSSVIQDSLGHFAWSVYRHKMEQPKIELSPFKCQARKTAKKPHHTPGATEELLRKQAHAKMLGLYGLFHALDGIASQPTGLLS